MPTITNFAFFPLLCIFSCTNVFAADELCDTGNNSLELAQCLAGNLKVAEDRLNSIYQVSLEKLPETSEWDTRKTKGQLVKAQNAWRIYRDENCTYLGGLQGGDNMWVTIFGTECAIDETNKRIEFFKHLPPSP
jgi:uncharacterized protein YecT (DUF1311 family)